MDARKLAAAKAVEKAALPIPGLSLENGQVSLDGAPFAQASDAEQIRASCAIAMRDNAKLRVLRVRRGNDLDEDSMQILADIATAADFQVWVERITPSGQDGIAIEDGRVKGRVQDEQMAPRFNPGYVLRTRTLRTHYDYRR